jgi:ABC-type transport system substrate-binding protein
LVCLSLIFGFVPSEVQGQSDFPDFEGEFFFVLHDTGFYGGESNYIANALSHIGISVIENQASEDFSNVNGNWDDPRPIYEEGGFDIATLGLLFFSLNFGNEPGWFPLGWDKFYFGHLFGYNNSEFFELSDQMANAWTDTEKANAYAKYFDFLNEELPYIRTTKEGSIIVYDKNLNLNVTQISGLGNTQNDVAVFSRGWADLVNPDSDLLRIGHNVKDAPDLIPQFYSQWELRAQFNYPSLVFQSLYERDFTSEYEWSPLLAEGMPQLTDSKLNATVKIREDIVFADGTPLTAYDVVESYKMYWPWWISTGSNQLYGVIDGLDGITQIDNYTIQFDFQYLEPDYMETMKVGIVPTHTWGNSTTALDRFSIHDQLVNDLLNSTDSVYGFGTGPFIYNHLTNSFAGDLSLIPNENYWEGEVNLNEIYFKNYEDIDSNNALLDIENGFTDILIDNVVSNMTKVKEMDLSFKLTSTVIDWIMRINHHHPIIGTGLETPNGIIDPSRAAEYAKYVRQAINYAIPRQEIIDRFNPKGTPNGFQLNEDNPYFVTDNTPKQNYTLAREYMERAGYEFPVEVFTQVTTPPDFIVTTPPKVNFASNAIILTLVVLVVLNKRIQLRRRLNL